MTHHPDLELLSSSFLFSGLAPEELAPIVALASRKSVGAKDVILRQGDAGSRMFAIVTGRIKITSVAENGREVVLGILGAGEFFGEMALIDGMERSATVAALEATDLLVLERHVLLDFLHQRPRAAVNLMLALSKRLRAANELIEDSVALNLPSRLAKKFLLLVDEHGVHTEGGERLEVKLSQQEIATLVGTTRESVNRIMRLWEDQGAIRYGDGHVVILDRRRLELWQK